MYASMKRGLGMNSCSNSGVRLNIGGVEGVSSTLLKCIVYLSYRPLKFEEHGWSLQFV